MMRGAQTLAGGVGVKPACDALGVSRAGFYRYRNPSCLGKKPKPRPAPPRALLESEKQAVLNLLHSERFMDKAPLCANISETLNPSLITVGR